MGLAPEEAAARSLVTDAECVVCGFWSATRRLSFHANCYRKTLLVKARREEKYQVVLGQSLFDACVH